MKIAKLNNLNFGARVKYQNSFHNPYDLDQWKTEPQLSIDARNVIAEVEELPKGYYFEILRDGCDNRRSANAPTNFLDILKIGICNEEGITSLPHKEIYHRREFVVPAHMTFMPSTPDREQCHYGELKNPNDLIGSLRKMVQDMRQEFEIMQIKRGIKLGLDKAEGSGLISALSRLANILGYKLVRKA